MYSMYSICLIEPHVFSLEGPFSRSLTLLRLTLRCAVATADSPTGSTPLHFAVDVDRPESAQLLLKLGRPTDLGSLSSIQSCCCLFCFFVWLVGWLVVFSWVLQSFSHV